MNRPANVVIVVALLVFAGWVVDRLAPGQQGAPVVVERPGTEVSAIAISGPTGQLIPAAFVVVENRVYYVGAELGVRRIVLPAQ